jgi:hypothetical protein
LVRRGEVSFPELAHLANDGMFGRVKPDLTLRRVLDHDFQPGIWHPRDIGMTAEIAPSARS